jgi:hypothetical protein
MRKRKEKEHEMSTGDGRRKIARTGRKAQVVKNRNTKNDKTDETGQQENIPNRRNMYGGRREG